MLTVTLIGANRDAWGYLLESVSVEHSIDRATGKAAYYMANGTPPGKWIGAGIAALGLNSDTDVKEEHLRALFGEGVHPLSGSPLGRRFKTVDSFEERFKKARKAAIADPANAELSVEEWGVLSEQIRNEVMATPEKQSVAGFEFVFSPPKSVSSWWALADPELKDEIRQAHHAAIQATIQKLETDIVRTRTGTDGVAQAHIQGISAALFDHWDSRDGDPQLHTHMLVSNRVQGTDGRWRTIDSRYSLMPGVATAGEYYDGVLMDELSARFGVDWTVDEVLASPEKYHEWLAQEARPDSPAARHQFALDSGTAPGSVKWQIAGISADLNAEFSTRSQAIKREKDRLVQEYVLTHGKKPSAKTVIQMRQHATLSTRRAKKKQSLRDLTSNWRSRALPHVGDSFKFADWLRDAGMKRREEYPLWSFRHDDVGDEAVTSAAEFVLHTLATARSTWGRRNAETAALRAIAAWRFRSPEDRDQAVNRVVEVVLSQAVPLTPRNNLHTPYRFRTADGEDMFQPQTRDLFTTREVWDAEERLMAAGRTQSGATVAPELVAELIGAPTGSEGRVLSADQAAAVENLVSSGRLVDVLVGPAGAGKTTSLEKLREIWEAEHGPSSVRGLAPTARAGEVLAESLNIKTENTAKWLYETAQGTETKDDFDYQLRAGDLMIVDEASIAGTLALDQLRAQAEQAGAKLLLVGDWAQLASVDAGGAFGLLAADRDDVAELVNLHRFTATWEADASKLLRLGKISGLDPYVDNERVAWGLDETIVADAVEAWKQDEATLNQQGDATLVSLLVGSTNDMVDRLNDLAREWRIEQGHVDVSQETRIASGVASPGDRIVTRENARTLRTDHDRWVKNNNEWEVVAINDETGDIVAASGEELVTLPAAYCREYVQLAYATTAHRAQGRTVDTSHAIVDSTATRETFYVAMTRGKHSNKAYVVVDEEDQIGNNASTGMTRTWREILESVILRKGGDIAAHDTVQDEAERIQSIKQLAAEYQTLTADQLERTYIPVLADLELIETDTSDSPYLGPVLANLRRVDLHGHDITETVTRLLAERELDGARDVLAVLHYRLESHLGDLREFEYGADQHAPLLESVRVPVGPENARSANRLFRVLRELDERGEDSNDAVRDALLKIDRASSLNLVGQLANTLARDHGINLKEIAAPTGLRETDRGNLIAGLIERAPELGDEDFTRALHDRELAIQIRAELLVDRALENDEAWIRGMGEPLPGGEAEWRKRAVTVACYRDLYGVDSEEALGKVMVNSRNRERDYRIAAAAYGAHPTVTFEQATPTVPDHTSTATQAPKF